MAEYRFEKAALRHRLGGKAVDIAMYIVTFGIGWFIWSLVVWGQGQTPGKQIVKLRIYNKATGSPARWGQTAIREFCLPAVISIVGWIVIGFLSVNDSILNHPVYLGVVYLPFVVITLVDTCFIFRGEAKNRLVDVLAKTDVLNETILVGDAA
ncbi:MAG: RDD family protein [Actinomycetes bacterium]